MNVEIKNDGPGADIGTHVDQNNQLHVFSIGKDVVTDAVTKGNAYNINTGWIALTTSTASGVFYFKNDEAPVDGESTYIIESLVIVTDGVGTVTAGDPTDIVIIANPTGGTLISAASAVAYKHNRNFGSSSALSTGTLAYKGVEGSTVTGGTSFALLAQTINTRASYPINIEIPKGSSMAITMDTQTTSGTTSVYVAMIGYRRDGKNS